MSDDVVKDAIDGITKAMTDQAVSALNASEGDAFDYGRACGTQQGLSIALGIIRDLLVTQEPDQMRHVPRHDA